MRSREVAGAARGGVAAAGSGRRAAATWRDFWDGDHALYANARHRVLHAERVARDLVALIPSPQAVLLDHGCGDALAAAGVAQRCGRLYLFDTSTRAGLDRLRGEPRITVLDEDGLAALPDGSLDLVFCCSVLQYVAPGPTDELFRLWRGKLKPGGRLVVADVIAPGGGWAGDVAALLRFAAEGGFLLAALRGLAATFFSPYRRLRAGLSTHGEAQMAALLRSHGFAGARAARNVGHNQARMTFVATRVD